VAGYCLSITPAAMDEIETMSVKRDRQRVVRRIARAGFRMRCSAR
jgi:hypothetical protein